MIYLGGKVNSEITHLYLPTAAKFTRSTDAPQTIQDSS